MDKKSTPCIDDHSEAAAGGSEGPAWDAGGYVFPATLFDDGPMQGTIGRFQRMGRQECVVLAIDMLGVGVSVELPPDCRYTAFE